MNFIMGRVENIEGKGENACENVWERVNTQISRRASCKSL